MARFVVLEGAPADTVHTAARELAGDDGRLVPVWAVALGMARTVCVGTVADADDAAQAVLAAVAGADLVVDALAEREVIDRLCDDLRRLGDLEHRVGVAPAGPALTADERALLARLLAGASLGQAARDLHLSRRTADRRLASARRALGASSTSEAIVLAARAGVKPA